VSATSIELRYGEQEDQWLSVSPAANCARGTAVLIHGGFWRAPYGAALMDRLAADLLERGWSVANLEYRRIGAERTVGYPAILEDVARAFGAIAAADAVTRPLVPIGHSAGGQLALWAASAAARSFCRDVSLPKVDAVVSQAGVVDLSMAAEARLGRDAVRALLGGGPAERPERYASACPMQQLPLGVPQLLVHGRSDEHVPCEMSERYAQAACERGDAATVLALDGVGHFEHLDPRLAPWQRTIGWLERLPTPKCAAAPAAGCGEAGE
jgi:acetyl esterase/lipase